MPDDAMFMRMAIEEARAAAAMGNAPFGAVIVIDGEVAGRGYNRELSDCDPTAHGEIDAIRAACRARTSPILTGATLYTTGEPCAMCATAMRWAGIGRLVIGAYMGDAQRYRLRRPRPETYPYEQVVGVLRDECLKLYEE